MTRWSFVLLAVLSAAAFGCRDKEAQEQAERQKRLLEDQTYPVTFTEPKIEDINVTLEVSGPLKSLDEVQVGAETAGRLTMVAVSDGSPVRAGQVIARVDSVALSLQVQRAEAALARAKSLRAQAEQQAKMSPKSTAAAIQQAEAALAQAQANLRLVRAGARTQDVERAKEQVNAAKATMEKRRTDFERMEELFKQEVISRSELEQAEWAYKTALADYRAALEALEALQEGSRPEEIERAEEAVRQAEAGVRAARANADIDNVRREQLREANAAVQEAAAALASAKKQLADAQVISPITGYVVGRPAQVGQVVAPGTPIARIVSLNSVYFEAKIPEMEVANVSAGQPVEVTVDALPDQKFSGTVAAVTPQADDLGRLFSARIAVENGRGLLKPGMFGKGRIITKRVRGATLVPTDAIRTENGEHFVFVAKNGKAKKVEVRIGLTQDGYTQLLDYNETEKLILGGKDMLTDGAAIREDTRQAGEK